MGTGPITGGLIMITPTAKRLVEIDQEMRNLTRAALTGQMSYLSAGYEIQKLAYEREQLWAKE